MSLQKQYNKFHENIKLSRESEEYKEAREKDDTILSKIEKAFKEEGYEIISNFIQGSLATHTGIKPQSEDFDIDRAIVISNESAPDNPIDPKKVVKKVLDDHGFKDPKIKIPCITANYISKKIHIDYIVYKENKYANHKLAVGKEYSDSNNRKWEDSDPKGLTDWISGATNYTQGAELTDDERRQFRRIARYIKQWRDNKYYSETERKKIYSIGLTIMLRKKFSPSVNDEAISDDNEALKLTLKEILNSSEFFKAHSNSEYNVGVLLPVEPKRDIFSKNGKTVGTTLRNRLENLYNKLLDVDNEEELKEKCKILEKEFGDQFPIPEDNKKSSTAKASAPIPGIVGTSSGA